MSLPKHVIFRHEYGAWSHARALQAACEQTDIAITLQPWARTRFILRQARRRDFRSLGAASWQVISPTRADSSLLVVGAAPFDRRIARVLRDMNETTPVVLFTSWDAWGFDLPTREELRAYDEWLDLLETRFDAIAAVSDDSRDSLLQLVPSLEDRVVVVGHSALNEPRNCERVSGDRRRVTFVGELVSRKGVMLLPRIADECEADIAIVGSGPLEGHLRQMAERRPNLRLAGRLSAGQVEATLARSDFLVMPSYPRELFGIVLVEALAAGCIPITTRNAGSRFLQERGLPVIVAEHTEFVETVANALRMTDAELQGLRQTAFDRFGAVSLGHSGERWLDALRLAVSRRAEACEADHG